MQSLLLKRGLQSLFEEGNATHCNNALLGRCGLRDMDFDAVTHIHHTDSFDFSIFTHRKVSQIQQQLSFCCCAEIVSMAIMVLTTVFKSPI